MTKRKFGKIIFAAALGIFLGGGGNLEQDFTIEARAAQLPSAVEAGESAARSLSDLEAGESAARSLPDPDVSLLAAQPPAVSDISVLALKDGISAGCTFNGYTDKSEYVIQLFLNRVDEDGSVS